MAKKQNVMVWTAVSLSLLALTACTPSMQRKVSDTTNGTGQASQNTVVTKASPTPSNTTSTSPKSGTNIQTAMEQYYTAHHAHIVHTYPTNAGILVEWNTGNKSLPSRFDWWDIKTHQRIPVPTGTAFTKVHTVSTRDVQLVATGSNDIGNGVAFPYMIDNYRGSDAQTYFQTTKRPYYLLLSHSVKFGDAKHAVMTSLVHTENGFQASFGPVAHGSGNFEAGDTGCPTMKTSYDAKTRVLTIRFLHTEISPSAKQSAGKWTSAFVTTSSLRQSGQDAILSLHLTSQCTHYDAKRNHLLNQRRAPYVTFRFAATMKNISPAIEESASS